MLLDKDGSNSANGVGTVRIKVVGVGGGGVNVVRRMSKSKIPGVDLLCVNTDVCSLQGVTEIKTIALGERVTRGLGAGGNPTVGRRAAEEAQSQLKSEMQGADLVFIAAGMGGGTGTGAAPVVAQLAQEAGALTVAVVTTPFRFEGNRRKNTALDGLKPLREVIDTLIVVSNDHLMTAVKQNTSVKEAFTMADQVMVEAILGVSNIINTPGEVNIDFADIKTVIQRGGLGLMSIGHGEGDRRLVKAARSALANPLVDVKAEGAKCVLFVVNGGPDVTLAEMNDAGAYIAGVADPEAQIFFGMHTDTQMRGGEVEIIIISTHLPTQKGYDKAQEPDSLKRLRATVPIFEADADVPPFLRKGWLKGETPSSLPPMRFPDWTNYGMNSSS